MVHGQPHGEIAYIALGSNLGDRAQFLAGARAGLADLPGSEIVAASDVEETMPVGPVDQPPYLNQMVALRTTLEPDVLLARLLDIERTQGRVRGLRWGPRTLDLDIVQFGDRTIDAPDLVVPHPELGHRPFWRRELEQLTRAIGAAAGAAKVGE
jgi:2-amino-4-hydroxy-6-hydroxymethyldihydropteridine diphosphokinase